MKFAFSTILVSTLAALAIAAPLEGEPASAQLSKRRGRSLNCSDSTHHCIFVEGEYDRVKNYDATDGQGTYLFSSEAQAQVVPKQGAVINVAFGSSHSSAAFGSGSPRKGSAYFSSQPKRVLSSSSSSNLITSDEAGDDLHVSF
ncbi:hypothetical protein IE53DRAFT_389023 [Violaceomyces palustris]|uniref:Uncharacterized protein n=1 Tax=Violaceomyces palustris TaxID=1673888 RepID=A0ACD0NSP1_9BASI|nr:hypothetical protein IE53DRAFT_389023 [Violaceomyces palustris]